MINYDEEFLKLLNKTRARTHYARITLLSFDDTPLEEIQGKITAGSLSANSASAIRRTISLTMAADATTAKLENVDNVISINKKVRVEIGLKNLVKDYIEQYGDIIWFLLGVFVLSSANSTRNTNSWNISISGKDKMALLDGTAGGRFPAPIVFNERLIDLADGSLRKEYPTIRLIIYEAVNHYGGIDPSQIFIFDLDDEVKMLVKNSGSETIYFSNNYSNLYYSLIHSDDIPVAAGEDVGYEMTDFTYPGELVLNAGDTVVSLLDKIVEVLGNYEYFFDVDGNFIFQEIKNYTNLLSPLNELYDDLEYLTDLHTEDYLRRYDNKRSVFSFSDLEAAAALTHLPKYDNIKNDFYVWGSKTNFNGDEVPIRYHLAIDARPLPNFAMLYMWGMYDGEGNLINYVFSDGSKPLFISDTDELKWITISPGITYMEQDVYEDGRTTWAKYITTEDFLTFSYKSSDWFSWLFDIPLPPDSPYARGDGFVLTLDALNLELFPANYVIPDSVVNINYGNGTTFKLISPPCQEYEWREELYRQALYTKTKSGFGYDNNTYYEELLTEWRKLYDPAKGGWNSDVYNHPDKLVFWLDIIDTASEIGKYSINQIGRRSEVVTNLDLHTIYNKAVPDIVFIHTEGMTLEEINLKTHYYDAMGQLWFLLNSLFANLFSISSTGASCFDEIRNMLYEHLNYHTTIGITCLPVYYLEPNNVIYIEAPDSGIMGNYQITLYTLPLTYNGTMNISATEVYTRI